ncbi:hypothetical protein QFC22_003997 [Naganishia vaughanmartiniae]|uniref:Uncharacterized protein n=1 Tax=Naganishia vaughanmartiniae TaxID=1424756 RepID=A0ACC2X318_9TREE|nr:hypothetical protein QFC22_003997 [Naganishia vaughanmartiniae]
MAATAAAVPMDTRGNPHNVEPYQDNHSDVAKLFIRAGDKPGKPLAKGPQIGSAGASPSFVYITVCKSDFFCGRQIEWKALYPSVEKVPDVSTTPKSWTAALAAAKEAGGYPSGVPLTTADASGNYVYPAGVNPSVEPVCSFPSGCNKASDFYNAPDGVLALSFDDGPTAATTNLTNFIKKNHISASHNMIGSHIVELPTQFQQIIASGGHLSVHTWSHQHNSALTDEQILAEIGWCMQVIYDNSGLVPKFWRPPFGDLDNRVRFIAENVFNLITLTWNRDSRDWAIPSLFDQTIQKSVDEVRSYVNGSKSPGMNILEHELNDACVTVFETVYRDYVKDGWDIRNLPDALSKGNNGKKQ